MFIHVYLEFMGHKQQRNTEDKRILPEGARAIGISHDNNVGHMAHDILRYILECSVCCA